MHKQRMRNPKIAMVCYVPPKGRHMILQVSLKLQKPIDIKFQDNIWTTKMCPAVQYYDVMTNRRWRTAAILKMAKSPYLSEKSFAFDEIWYTCKSRQPRKNTTLFPIKTPPRRYYQKEIGKTRQAKLGRIQSYTR